MMAEQEIKNNYRQEALDMVAAAMAIIIQTQDLSLSAEIINDAGDKYGRDLIEGLLLELTESGLAFTLSSVAADIMIKRAMLSMIKPLPLTWMETRN